MSIQESCPCRPRGGVPLTVQTVLAKAHRLLDEAAAADSPSERFRLAHVAALRTVAALFADRGRPASARHRLVPAWDLIEQVAPELAHWATYFAAAAPARAAVEAGVTSAVTERDGDEQLWAAAEFLRTAESAMGLLSAPLAS